MNVNDASKEFCRDCVGGVSLVDANQGGGSAPFFMSETITGCPKKNAPKIV